MPTRAPAMKPDERRAHLLSATVVVLRRSGMAATTKEIAAEAEVAEGTIFRVFSTKDELIQSSLVTAFDPAPYWADWATSTLRCRCGSVSSRWSRPTKST